MGNVRDVYMLYEKAGDQYIGRLTAGLPVLSEKFAVSNPDFIPVEENGEGLFLPVLKTAENEAELDGKIRIVIEGLFGDQLPTIIRPFLRIGLACHLHHRPKLDVLYPADSALRLTSLYTSQQVKDWQKNAKVGFPWDQDYSMYWEEPTGIPPHVIELAKLAEIKRMVADILPGFQRILTSELDDRAVNGVMSETRMRDLMSVVFEDKVRPLVTAMTANRQVGQTGLALAAPERPPPPGAIQETGNGFYIFHHHGKLRRVPEAWCFPHCPLATAYELYHCGDEIGGISPLKVLSRLDVDYLNRGRQNLHEFKYLMAMIDAEATRLGKEVEEGSRAHYKSIFFLRKGALGLPRFTKTGRSRRVENLTWATAIKIIGCKSLGAGPPAV
jgi:hypothetical protein